jgi:hypothetical protein
MVLSALALLLAMLATAELSHAILSVGGDLLGSHAYEERAHAAFVPAVLLTAILACSVLFGSATRHLARAQSTDPVLASARHFRTVRPLAPCIAVAAGGFVLLAGMEFLEQLVARGRIEGIGDALGGNVWIGLTIVAAVAAVVTAIGLRFARAMIRAAAAIVDAVATWVFPDTRALAGTPAMSLRTGGRSDRRATQFSTRWSGLRAPPFIIAYTRS